MTNATTVNATTDYIVAGTAILTDYANATIAQDGFWAAFIVNSFDAVVASGAKNANAAADFLARKNGKEGYLKDQREHAIEAQSDEVVAEFRSLTQAERKALYTAGRNFENEGTGILQGMMNFLMGVGNDSVKKITEAIYRNLMTDDAINGLRIGTESASGIYALAKDLLKDAPADAPADEPTDAADEPTDEPTDVAGLLASFAGLLAHAEKNGIGAEFVAGVSQMLTAKVA
jgi:hypothetical protein